MRLFTSALCATVAVGLLAGCSGNSLSTPSSSAPVGAQANHIVNGHFIPGYSRFANLVPVELRPTGPQPVLDRITPDKHKEGRRLGQPVLRQQDQRLRRQPKVEPGAVVHRHRQLSERHRR
jgi:hypothetical protein